MALAEVYTVGPEVPSDPREYERFTSILNQAGLEDPQVGDRRHIGPDITGWDLVVDEGGVIKATQTVPDSPSHFSFLELAVFPDGRAILSADGTIDVMAVSETQRRIGDEEEFIDDEPTSIWDDEVLNSLSDDQVFELASEADSSMTVPMLMPGATKSVALMIRQEMGFELNGEDQLDGSFTIRGQIF